LPDQNARGVIKRSILIAGHRTSISLEEAFWQELKRLAAAEAVSVAQLIGRIDLAREGNNLSSAIRLHILAVLIEKADPQSFDGMLPIESPEV